MQPARPRRLRQPCTRRGPQLRRRRGARSSTQPRARCVPLLTWPLLLDGLLRAQPAKSYIQPVAFEWARTSHLNHTVVSSTCGLICWPVYLLLTAGGVAGCVQVQGVAPPPKQYPWSWQ